jgi:uncharacterized protein (TIGR00266 family)
MKYKKLGGSSFSFLRFTLKPGEKLTTESGAMASMGPNIELKSKLNGGIFRALLIKYLGKETIFINTLSNKGKDEQQVYITQPTPGEIVCQKLEGETLYIQAGSYIASTKGIKFKLSWAGFSSFIAGEGLFRIRAYGKGFIWYGAYGSIIEKEIDGEYLVDTGHLLSYSKDLKLKIQLSGGIFSSFFSGEGFLLRLEGKGKIQIQTRSLGGVAGWLNPKFW